MAIAYGATVLALRAIFEQPQVPMMGEAMSPRAYISFESPLTTALLSPLIFAGTSRLLSLGSKKREERTIAG